MKLKIQDMTLIALFAVLTIIGGKIAVSLPPFATFTLQSLVCLMAGLLLGAKRALLSQVVYILLGLIGLPVFAKGGGIGYIFEPTFGFVIGMLAAAWLIGLLSDLTDPQRSNLKIWQAILINFAGQFLIYIFGVTFLYLIKNFYAGSGLTFLKAIEYGMIPYLIFDTLKSILAGVIGPRLRKITSQFAAAKK